MNQQTLDLNTRQYNDNKRKADLGAIAPIDIIQAEAEMKASQQDVTTSRAQVLNQEMILKNYLTRGAMDNLAIVEAHIVPTDHFDVPAQEIVRPIQDLITEAMANRPDVEQSQIGLENSRITTLGVKDAMLPRAGRNCQRIQRRPGRPAINTVPVARRRPRVHRRNRQPVLPGRLRHSVWARSSDATSPTTARASASP